MQSRNSSFVPFCLKRRAILSVISIGLLIGTTGVDCDSDAAAAFRAEATSAIGDGVKTIVNGVLDGIIAAIEEAGDGSNGD